MGQGASKRQSYTPGEKKDAGLPSPAENGDINKTGTNGKVELLSNKEVAQDDVTPADDSSATPTSSVPPTPTTSTSPTSPTDKKKRRVPRFVFSLKRTGSGKRSRKPNKEVNGIRPTSYPAAKTGEQTSADSARPQSLFLEEITIPEDDGKVETVSLSSNDEHKEKKDSEKRSSSKSPSSKSSSLKARKDKKKDGSEKKKSSKKKKEKEEKAKAEKQRKESEKENAKKEEGEGDKDKEEKAEVVEEVLSAEVAKTEEQTPEPQAEEAKSDEAGTDEAKADDKTETPPEGATATQESEAVIKDTVAAVEETEVKTGQLTERTEEPEAKAEEQSETPAEQTEAEGKHTSPKEGEEEDTTAPETGTEKPVDQKDEAEEEKTEESQDTNAKPPEVAPPHDEQEEQQETASEVSPSEVIVEVTNISTQAKEPTGEEAKEPTEEEVKEPTEEEAKEPTEEEAKEPTEEEAKEATEEEAKEPTEEEAKEATEKEAKEATGEEETAPPEDQAAAEEPEVKADDEAAAVADEKTEVVKEVFEEIIVVEVHAAAEAVKSEPVDETVQQQVQAPAESAPATEVADSQTEDENKDTVDAAQSEQPGKLGEAAGDSTQAAANSETTQPPEPAAENESKPPEETPPVSPAQLKALEKERKAAKKREEKERAKKEKEEKKRLKEQKKREAKEKKQKEKEEKERRLREAKEKAKAAAVVKTEVQPEEATKTAVEETVSASQSATTESPPGTSTAEPATDTQEEAQAEVTEPGAMGSTVKEIISSIEGNVSSETKPANDHQPPAVPDTPYPDEDVVEPSSASTVFSSPSGSTTSSPLSPTSPVSPLSDGRSPATSVCEDSDPGSPMWTETGENGRSGGLRKIELGPRLRTAILRKNSSGAENEEKRVNLTQPRHVQVSDLTPPPRKQRPRRPLEQVWSPYTTTTTTRPEEPKAAIEEQLTVVAASSSESAPPPTSSPERTSENAGDGETAEQQKSKDREGEYQVMAGLPSPGSRVSVHADPESPTVVSVATIVLSGQGETLDNFPNPDAPHQAPTGEEDVQVNAEGDTQTQPDEAILQKMAAQMVVEVQKAAQEQAAAIVSEDKVDVKCEDTNATAEKPDSGAGEGDGSAVCSAEPVNQATVGSSTDSGVSGPAVVSESPEVCVVVVTSEGEGSAKVNPQDSDAQDAGDSQAESASVSVCDSEQSGRQASPPPASSQDATQAVSQQSDACVAEAKVEPVAAETETVLTEPTDGAKDDLTKDKEGEKENDTASSAAAAENKADEDEADTSQLQQFKKNYYDISVVVDEGDEEDDVLEKNNVKESESTVGSIKLEPENSQASESGECEGQQSVVQTSEDSQDRDKVGHSEEPGSHSDETSSPSSDETITSSVTDAQLANGQATAEDGEETKTGDGVATRCNGSHELNASGADSNETIDAYLRLQGGPTDGKQVADKMESNNNISNEKESSEQAEKTACATPSDSVD